MAFKQKKWSLTEGILNVICNGINGKSKGIRFIVLYPPKCSHDLPPIASLYARKPFQSPGGYIPEQLESYSAQALSTALSMLGTHFAAG